jgi:polyisoprenoid-binding protein YceI
MLTTLRSLLLAAATAALVNPAAAAVETYAIDPVHSSVGFQIRHFVSKVPGSFTKFNGTLTVDRDNLENSSAEATIDVGSVSTANERRDNHLRSPDFFNAAQFTTAAFKSTSWKKTGDDTFDITGDFTLHGVTKPVVLHTTLLGFGPGPRGGQLSGWEATATIKKSDFGVNGPAMLAKALGDEVTLHITVEAGLKQQ